MNDWNSKLQDVADMIKVSLLGSLTQSNASCGEIMAESAMASSKKSSNLLDHQQQPLYSLASQDG